MSRLRVLSITYDESLLQTREMILSKAGFDVTSALGFVDAQRLCAEQDFDVVVIGHTLPRNDKLALLRCAKQGGTAATLCLRNPSDPVMTDADYSTDRIDPEGLVKAVHETLARRKPGAGS